MNYESIKKQFIELKKEELNYIDNVAKVSSSKTLSELEKLEIYRRIKKYGSEIDEILKKLRIELIKSKKTKRPLNAALKYFTQQLLPSS